MVFMWFSRFLCDLSGFYVVSSWSNCGRRGRAIEGWRVRGAQRVRRVRLVIFIIGERAKGRMYAGVRSDLSGVIRKALETVERGSSQPRGLRRLRGIDSKSVEREQEVFGFYLA